MDLSAVPAHMYKPGHGYRLGKCEESPCNQLLPVMVKAKPDRDELKNPHVGEFSAWTRPNPARISFTFFIQSDLTDPVNVKVTDVLGRVVYQSNGKSANSTLRFGERLFSGTYYAEIIQGSNRKTVKLMKVK